MFLTRSFTGAHPPGSLFQRGCNRTFFTPPSLPSFFSSTSDEPQRYHERKILPYRPSQLYDVVSDVASYPKFLPYCTNTRILSRTDGASGTKMDAEMTPHQYVQAVASSSSPIFKSLTTIWRFQPASSPSPCASNATPPSIPPKPSHLPDNPSHTGSSPDEGPTLVTLDLSFLFAYTAYAGASQMFFGQVSRMMVSAFEQRCLELYGPSSKW